MVHVLKYQFTDIHKVWWRGRKGSGRKSSFRSVSGFLQDSIKRTSTLPPPSQCPDCSINCIWYTKKGSITMTTHLVIRPPPTECFLPANYTFFQEPVTLGSVTPAAGCRICEPRIWRADRITNLITTTARWPTWFCRVVKKKLANLGRKPLTDA